MPTFVNYIHSRLNGHGKFSEMTVYDEQVDSFMHEILKGRERYQGFKLPSSNLNYQLSVDTLMPHINLGFQYAKELPAKLSLSPRPYQY